MCGSVSFYKYSNFITLFDYIKTKIKGFYIMVGILSNAIPLTMSITMEDLKNIRKPTQATANQYYSPDEYIKLLGLKFNLTNQYLKMFKLIKYLNY